MKSENPQCHESQSLTKLRQPFQVAPGFVIMALLGGGIGGLFWGLGQENKYRCEQCQTIFFSHTHASRVFWVLAIVTYATIGALLLYGIIASMK